MKLKRFDFYTSINKHSTVKYTKKEVDSIYKIKEDETIDFEHLYTLSDKQTVFFNRSKFKNQTILSHGAKRAGKTKSMILASLRDIYDYSRQKNRVPAIFLVTAATDALASSLFLRETNEVFYKAGLTQEYNVSGHVDSCIIFGIMVKFLGLARKDAYTKIMGQTVLGWFGTEITAYDEKVFPLCFSRVSAGKQNIYFDANPQSTSHWTYRNYIIPNRNNIASDGKKGMSLLHFNYLDSINLFEGAKDYWEMMEANVYNMHNHKKRDINNEELIKSYSELFTREHLEIEDKPAFKIINDCDIDTTELGDKFGFWTASQNEPLKNLVRYDLDLNLIRKCYSVAFLDLANTANNQSCYTALAIAYRHDTPISHCYYFIGKLFAKPYYETYDDVLDILKKFQVDRFYYDLHGAGVGMKDLPQFARYGGTGLLQTRNKLSRISDMSLLIDNGVLKASSFCEDDFFHQVRSFRFTEKIDNNDIMIKRIKGYCDAPDAVESAVRVLIKGEHRFNEDDKQQFKSV